MNPKSSMLHCYNPPRSVLDLPPEIMVKIVDKLTYTDIESVRLTCCAFNEAGKYVQKKALRKMRNKADLVLRRCHRGFQNVNETRALRALRGTASVKCLSGILRIADASTFHFVVDGACPPAPGALLADVEKALVIAAKKNPLVGRNRLKHIFASVNKYLTAAFNRLCVSNSLRTISVYHSAIGLLESLPLKTYTITPTGYGLHCLVNLNPLAVSVDRRGCFLTAPQLIRFLGKLNVQGIQEFINICMGGLFSEEGQIVDATIDLIEVMMQCRPEQSVGVTSLRQMCRIEPVDFTVRIHGVSIFKTPSRRTFRIIHLGPIRGRPLLEGEEIATYTFTTRPMFPEAISEPSNNSVSNTT